MTEIQAWNEKGVVLKPACHGKYFNTLRFYQCCISQLKAEFLLRPSSRSSIQITELTEERDNGKKERAELEDLLAAHQVERISELEEQQQSHKRRKTCTCSAEASEPALDA
jgi:hypothetical protein